MLRRVPAVDHHAAEEGAAGEVRYEAVDGAEERGLADARVTYDEAEFSLLHGQVHVPQDRIARVLVLDGDLVEGDHVDSSVRCAGTAGRTGGLGGGARNPAVPARRIAAVGTSGSVGQLSG